MDLLKTLFAWIGVIAFLCALAFFGMMALLKYEDRQWRKKQGLIDDSCDLPSNDN